jgi:hypothetical protein
LLHYSFLSRHGKAKASELYSKVKEIVPTSAKAKEYALQLKADAEALDKLMHGDAVLFSPATNNMLLDIREALGVKLCYPYLIAAYRTQVTASFNKAIFEAHVRVVMNFAFRYMKVLDGEVGPLASIIQEAIELVVNGKTPTEVGKEFAKAAPDSLFLQELRTASFSNTKLAYFTVCYIESARLSGTVPLPHGKESNLEHIMPRTPNAAGWPHIVATKSADPEQFKEYLWRLGNLLPLPEDINKAIQNKAISYKMLNGTGKSYAACSLASPKDIAPFLVKGEWTYASIEKRQNDLVDKYAKNAWPL